jgi:hypothetical protein
MTEPEKKNTERHGRGHTLIKQFLPNMRYNEKGNEAKFTLPVDMKLLKEMFVIMSQVLTPQKKSVMFTPIVPAKPSSASTKKNDKDNKPQQ